MPRFIRLHLLPPAGSSLPVTEQLVAIDDLSNIAPPTGNENCDQPCGAVAWIKSNPETCFYIQETYDHLVSLLAPDTLQWTH